MSSSAPSCAAVTTPGSMWNKLCPSLPASIIFVALFSITTLVHVVQAFVTRKAYCAVIILSAVVQTLTYVFHTLSIIYPASYNYYAAWFVLILIAPRFTNAFAYMVFGRMVWNFTDDQRLGIRPWRITTLFVVLDIVALSIQVYGVIKAAGYQVPQDEVLKGLHIYMGGVGLQQASILVLFAMAVLLRRKIRVEQKRALPLLYTLYAVLALITVSPLLS